VFTYDYSTINVGVRSVPKRAILTGSVSPNQSRSIRASLANRKHRDRRHRDRRDRGHTRSCESNALDPLAMCPRDRNRRRP